MMYPSTTSVSLTTLFTLLLVSTTYAQDPDRLPTQSISLIPETTTTDFGVGGIAVPTQTASNCIINCFTNAAASNGCNINDNSCICSNSNLQTTAINCVQSQCSQPEVQQAQQVLNQACQAASGSPQSSLTIGNPFTDPNFTPTFGVIQHTNGANLHFSPRNSIMPIVAAMGVGLFGLVAGGALLL
ncbi:hypothetical protein BDN72DRAFT_96069 [Pluteus cervinus]|uniref:Uncharacterized protein n=1 Tax=Pluteus cervinus TaxID=181527 RepID=A0ACD3ANH5_9AGAR|nr:hypothetical protein BDN72DRAFT_96069 [Pluteus cervinus]